MQFKILKRVYWTTAKLYGVGLRENQKGEVMTVAQGSLFINYGLVPRFRDEGKQFMTTLFWLFGGSTGLKAPC